MPFARSKSATPRSASPIAAATLIGGALPCGAFGQIIIEGDTIRHGRLTYRLWGIDAPESQQTCPDGWPAGSLATTRLQSLISGGTVVCDDRGRDRYSRTIARCEAAGEDLGAIMVREGLAWA